MISRWPSGKISAVFFNTFGLRFSALQFNGSSRPTWNITGDIPWWVERWIQNR